jgi:hypothetical protein
MEWQDPRDEHPLQAPDFTVFTTADVAIVFKTMPSSVANK